tara:strand:- start:272 stop:1534 length:1263 start_codon:yes stop_codon:yes gene_type:complete
MRPSAVLVLLALFVSLFYADPAQAQDKIRVNSAAELQQALKNAASGGLIELAAGDYGNLSLHGLTFPKNNPLVLRSENPTKPARFLTMTLRDVGNVVIEDVVFDYIFQTGDPLYLRPFQILSSDGITIRDTVFDGDLAQSSDASANGFGTGFGLSVIGSSWVTLEGSEIYDFHRGMIFSQSNDISIRSNDVHSIRSDGMNFAEVKRILIENNYIHDFARSLVSKDHADMIQFWTNGTDSPSRDIVIRNNVLNSGQGGFTQSIFMRNDMVDRGLAGPEMFYRNLTIEENVIINAHLHGITIGETDGLVITNNSVLRNSKSEGKKDNLSLWTPKITVAKTSRNVKIMRNVTSRIDGDTGLSDWKVRDNFFVQDSNRMKPGFYGLVFVKEVLRDPSRLKSFAPRPGGPLDKRGIGAARLLKGS